MSYATMIPMVMAMSPLVGWFLGQWIGGLVHYPKAGATIGIAMGLAAGILETIKIIKRLIEESK